VLSCKTRLYIFHFIFNTKLITIQQKNCHCQSSDIFYRPASLSCWRGNEGEVSSRLLTIFVFPKNRDKFCQFGSQVIVAPFLKP
jgi:hypothetical protein